MSAVVVVEVVCRAVAGAAAPIDPDRSVLNRCMTGVDLRRWRGLRLRLPCWRIEHVDVQLRPLDRELLTGDRGHQSGETRLRRHRRQFSARCAHVGRLVEDYDPTTGTFLTRDPLDGVDGTPTVANPYHYVDNDPLNKTDPLGLRAQDADFNPCAGPLSPQGEAYCQKHGAPPSTFCQTSVDQCLGLGGQYQGKTLDANQYRDPQHFMKVLRSYIGSEPQLRVRWIESLGGGANAVAYMDARDFERAFGEVEAGKKLNLEKQKEWLYRFVAKAAVSFSVAAICTFGFAICFGAAVAGTVGGTALLTASDMHFGHEVNWNENISDAGLSALAGVACRLWTGGGCLGSFYKSAAPSTPLTLNAGKVAAIWITSFAMDKAVFENNMS